MTTLHGRPKFLFHCIFWIVFITLSFFFYANFWTLHLAFIRALVNGFLFILLFYTNLKILIPGFFFRRNYFLYVFSSFLLVVLIALIRILMRNYWFGEPTTIRIVGRPYVSEFLIITSLIFVFMLSVFYQLIENQLLASERNREIERQRDEAELRMLKSQVNPHFLFNTLNNLYALSYGRSDKTPGAIMALSEIMRYLIYETGANLVSAEKEVKFIQNYIKLENLRIEDAGKVSFSVEQPAPGMLIAPLLFISFIENAFKHSGIDTDPEGFIQIFLAFCNNEIVFTCENSIGAGRIVSEKGGIGLKNARTRLELMYPQRYHLEIRKTEFVFAVSLTIQV